MNPPDGYTPSMTSQDKRAENASVSGGEQPRVASIESNENVSIPQGALFMESIAWTLKALLVLASIYALSVGAVVLVPVALAFLIYFLLAPLTTRLQKWHVPRSLAAIVSLFILCAPFGLGAIALSEPAAEWLRIAPTSIDGVRHAFEDIVRPFQPVKEASDAVNEAVEVLTGSPNAESETVVTVREPGLLENVMTDLPEMIVATLLSIVIAFLLLIDNDRFITSISSRSRTFADMKRARQAVEQMKSKVAQYLSVVLMINMALGAACALAFYMLGLPNPILWGAFAGILNFAPYIGPAVTTFVLLIVGLVTSPGETLAFLPALVFLGLTILEGQLITPMLVGSVMAISPVIVLLAVMSFAALWGVAGALMAVPLFVTGRVLWRSLAESPQLLKNEKIRKQIV